MASVLPAPVERPALPPPYDGAAAPVGVRPASATRHLVRGEIRSMLESAPVFAKLDHVDRVSLEHHMNKVASYAAECLRDDWLQSEQLGQRPVRVQHGPRALAAADDFEPAAASRIAGVTEATLQAISFPEFVTDLVRGTFSAIVDASIQQMEAYVRLLEDVAKTVDQFMADNITDNQARDWLVQRYPRQIRLAEGEPRLVAAEGADEAPDPGWKEALLLSEDVDPGDEDAYEEVLVPAARRKLAQGRLQTLSTLVLMGVNRVIVTGGKIRATMAFHIDTTDRAAQQHATDFDFRTAAQGSVGFGAWSASASTSVAYVTSSRSQSDAEMNVETDVTGEVELHFASDVFPLERFLDGEGAQVVQSHTAVPAQNQPTWGSALPMRKGTAENPPSAPVRPIGQLPTAPAAPAEPTPVREAPSAGDSRLGSGAGGTGTGGAGAGGAGTDGPGAGGTGTGGTGTGAGTTGTGGSGTGGTGSSGTGTGAATTPGTAGGP